MSKQDRQGVRTPTDLERKYSFKKKFDSFTESSLENSRSISELASRTQKELNTLSESTNTRIDATNKNVGELSVKMTELNADVENMTDGFTIIVNGVATGNADNPNKVVIDGTVVNVYVNEKLVQTFDASGAVSMPVLNVTALMTLLGLQIEETATNIDCYYGSKVVWSFLKSGGEIVGVAVGKQATEEVFEVALPVTFDVIVEQGVANGWTYRKWESGLAECWMTLEHSTALSTEWGALYSGTATSRQNYPFTFMARPTEIVSLQAESYQGLLFPEKNSLGVNTESQTACYNICRPSSITTSSKFYLNFNVSGRWK